MARRQISAANAYGGVAGVWRRQLNRAAYQRLARGGYSVCKYETLNIINIQWRYVLSGGAANDRA